MMMMIEQGPMARAKHMSHYEILNVSGGLSSAYMLWLYLDEHDGELPEGTLALFANTGKEREETLAFVRDLTTHWGVPITWLEYRYHPERRGRRKGEFKNDYELVDFDTASRNGRPFDELILGHQYLPNQDTRICTQELKVETFRRYLTYGLGAKTWVNALGIRFDEPRRWAKRINDPDLSLPLVTKRVSKKDVLEFWGRQNFRLGIPSWKGNCDLCFLKGKKNLIHTMRNEPELADWWIAHEERAALWRSDRQIMKAEMVNFSKRHSFEELLDASKQPQLFEIVNLDDEPAPDCWCGD